VTSGSFVESRSFKPRNTLNTRTEFLTTNGAEDTDVLQEKTEETEKEATASLNELLEGGMLCLAG
jgi:hypothetical protein